VSEAETGVFDFAEPASETGRMSLYFHCPADWQNDGPILIALHGYKRNAEDYRNDWKAVADHCKALLLAPAFDEIGFPGPRAYEVGGMRTPDRKSYLPRDMWSYQAVERAFDAGRKSFGAKRNNYWLYGHSAGGQFVHRLALFLPEARFSHAIAANAGAYTAPDGARFPYGLGHGAPEIDMDRFLARPLTMLLGQKDRNATAKVLLKSPEATLQGPHRLARGRFFYQSGKAVADAAGLSFGWRIVEAPHAGHSNRLLAPVAGQLFLAGSDQITQTD
jgi:poly(3-hydroxybutyrate) depolymerase